MSEATVSEVIVRGIVVGVFAENAWVIGNRRTGEAIAIDPGDQPEEILAMARDMGVTIKIIANSHAHIDHILGVRGVQSATGAKFLLHQGDLPIARNAAGTAEISAGSGQTKSPSAYTLIPGHSTSTVLARAVVTSSSSTWVPLIAVGKKRTSFVREADATIVMSRRPSEGSALGHISIPPP